MVPRGKAVILAVFVSLHFTTARRPTWPAFLVQLRTRAHTRREGAAASGSYRCAIRCAIRKAGTTTLFSAAEKTDSTQQLSDMDARVLDELLSDPSFMESLMEQGVQFEGENGDDGGGAGFTNRTEGVANSSSGGLTIAGEIMRGAGSSVFESATMVAVEGLQDSVKGLLAKVSAAIESASIYVANRARMDVKVVQAVVEYASNEASAGTSRLLLAATGAASPALLLMGVNTTETQAALNDSLQLLSMGILPDSLGAAPKLLTSFKDFDDDDKRLDAAYRRQRRRTSKPLAAKLLGALPSTLNKAADLVYEVDQEVKYERAGNRANRFLRPIGLVLPEAKRAGILSRREPAGTGENLLPAPDADDGSTAAPILPPWVRDAGVAESSPAVGDNRTGISGVVQAAEAQANPLQPSPDPLGVLYRFGRKPKNPKEERSLPGTGSVTDESTARIDPDLAAVLAAQPHVLFKELAACTSDASERTRWYELNVRAANALLCSTGPVVAELEEGSKREALVLQELKNMAVTVQQVYVLAEMSEAVEAAETHLRRLAELSGHVVELAAELETYVAVTDTRFQRLLSIGSRLREARDPRDVADGVGVLDLDFVSGVLELLHTFDDEIIGHRREAEGVEERLDVVRRESPERASDDGRNAHEEALMAACRLWDASVVDRRSGQARTIDRIALELARIEGPELSTPSSPEVEAGYSTTMPAEVGRAGVAEVGKTWRRNEGAKAEYVKPQAYVETRSVGGSDDEHRRVSRADKGTTASVASVDGDTEVKGSPAGPEVSRRRSAPKPKADGVVLDDTIDAAKVDPNPDFSFDLPVEEANVVEATVVTDATVVKALGVGSLEERGRRPSGSDTASNQGRLWEESSSAASDESILEVVGKTQSFVDIEVDVEDVPDQTKVALKVLDVSALLIEKVLFVGLPTVISGGALVWERVDNAVNGAKGRKGWKLLSRLKKDPVDRNETRA